MSQKVFILHGWTYSLDKWKGLTESLRARGVEPLLLKIPGLTSPSTKVWDIDSYCEWLENELGQDPSPIVIGHSNGGRIALAYIQRHPKRIKQLILIDSAGVTHEDNYSRLRRTMTRRGSIIAKIVIRNEAIKKILNRAIGARDYANAPMNMKQTMQNMLSADSSLDFSAVKTPTTIIWGRDDTITPLRDGEALHAAIVGSKLHVIGDARHAPFFNYPDQIADIIAGVVIKKT